MALMIAEFAHYYHMSIPEIFQMPAQMFFIFYRQIVRLAAGNMVNDINALTLAKAIQYAEAKDKAKVEREFKKIVKISQGKK